jgi:hypothetical protein
MVSSSSWGVAPLPESSMRALPPTNGGTAVDSTTTRLTSGCCSELVMEVEMEVLVSVEVEVFVEVVVEKLITSTFTSSQLNSGAEGSAKRALRVKAGPR